MEIVYIKNKYRPLDGHALKRLAVELSMNGNWEFEQPLGLHNIGSQAEKIFKDMELVAKCKPPKGLEVYAVEVPKYKGGYIDFELRYEFKRNKRKLTEKDKHDIVRALTRLASAPHEEDR